MFSVYGRAGRVFHGSMEELRDAEPVGRISRSRRVAPLGQDAADQSPERFVDLLRTGLPHPSTGSDMAHRSALAAYAQTSKADTQRHLITHVDAIMSHAVLTIADTATVDEAWQFLAREGVGQAPVVGANGVLVGLLTRAELLRLDRLPGPDSYAVAWRALLAQGVVDIMLTPVPSVAAETDVRRVAGVLLDTNLPGLPVADDQGRVVGFVSRSDILRAVVADPPLDLWT